jgi:hypothetical protein
MNLETVVRFDAPPTWPTASTGWAPPVAWQPEATWPPAPEGWHYWLADDGAPLPVVNTQVPPWDRRSVGAPLSDTGAGGGAAARRAELITFFLGAAVFLVGAGSAIFAAKNSSGGFIWTGGMFFGAVLFFRAWRSHEEARKLGAPYTPEIRLLVVVTAVACVAAGGFATFQWFAPSEIGGSAGSCWVTSDGDMLQEVSCGSDHEYKVTAWVADPDECAATVELYVEGKDGDVGCLKED